MFTCVTSPVNRLCVLALPGSASVTSRVQFVRPVSTQHREQSISQVYRNITCNPQQVSFSLMECVGDCYVLVPRMNDKPVVHEKRAHTLSAIQECPVTCEHVHYSKRLVDEPP